MGLLVLFVVAIVATPFLAWALARTPVYWLPSAGLVGVAWLLYSHGLAPPGDHGPEPALGYGAFDGLGNVIVTIAIIGLLVYALFCFVATRQRRSSPVPPAVPPAIVVDDSARR